MDDIEDGIKQVNKIYLQHGFKITRINYDSEFKLLRTEVVDIGIALNCVSNKKNILKIEHFIWNVK